MIWFFFFFFPSNATFPAGDGFLPPERSYCRDSHQTRQERGERQGGFPGRSLFSPAERVFRRAGSPKGIWGKDRACCRASCPSPILVPGSRAGGFLIFISKRVSTADDRLTRNPSGGPGSVLAPQEAELDFPGLLHPPAPASCSSDAVCWVGVGGCTVRAAELGDSSVHH